MGTGGGGRVAVRRGKMDDDDDDEYVVDEDEEEVEEDDAEYVAAACSDEEDAGEEGEEEEEPEPDHESDADFDGDEEAEDEDFEIETPRPRPRARGRKPKPEEDESDADFDEDEELEIETPRPKRRPAAKARGRRSRAKPDEDESDADFDEDEELEIETPRPKRAAKARGRGRKVKKPRDDSDADSDEDDELFQIETPRPKRPAKARARARKVKKPRDDSDEDFGEDEGFEIEAPRRRRPATVRSRRGGRKGKREDESDADFDLGEEELEIETRPAAVRSRGGRKGSQEDESDEDFGRDEEEFQDEELEIETHPAEVPSRGREEKQEDESDADVDVEEELEDGGLELEIEAPRPEHPNGKQDDEFDEDFYEEPEDQEADEELETEIMEPMQPIEGCGWGRKKKPSGSRRPRHEDDDDYEEEIEDEDDDFDPEVDEEEDGEEEEVEEDDEDLDEYAPTRAIRPKNHLAKRKPAAGRLHRKRRSGSRVSKGKARKGTSAHQRRRKQRVDDDEEDDDEEDDDDFVVNDDVEDEVDYQPRKKAKVGTTARDGTAEPLTVGEAWPSLESDTSEFEFVTSEEEHAENEAPTAEPARIKRKKGRRKRGSESDSSSDSDYVISEEELEPMPQETVPQLLPSTSRRTIIPRRVDEKGKELEEALKQICGICLSEEQRATVQGVLNCCSHYFCFACILEWSKVESRCPLCKRRFSTITKSSVADVGSGLRNAAIRVEKRDQVYQPTEDEMRRWLDPYENVVCIECNQGGEDNLMLLCDICDSSAHTFCVGLGREVPEGNWYCGGCRSSVEGPSYAQTQDSVVHRGESNMNTADSSSSSFSRPVSSGVFQRPPPLNIHPPSLQGFDLNLSPIETPDEDKRAESHISAEAVSTPTGRHATLDRRRALNRRIRILLFRPRTATNAWQNGLQHDRTTQGTEQNQRSICTSTDLSPSCSRADLLQSQQSSSHFVQSASNHTQGTGNNFREVANAKEQLIPIVKKSIKHICARSPLDQSAFMNVARRATNTILALSGISHNTDRVVATPFPFPSHCCHACDGREPAFLMRTICSACFNSFVGDVVSHIANMSS